MKSSLIIFFDGNKYLLVDSNSKIWSEGDTLEIAYQRLKNKNFEINFLQEKKNQLIDVGLIWLKYRKSLMIILFVFAFVYAQAAVFLGLFSYLGHTPVDRIVFIIDGLTNKIENLSDDDQKKIKFSLTRFQLSWCKFVSSENCTAVNNIIK